jgi:hypothetical protein
MPEARFQLTYDGRDLRDSAMNVYELGPALVAVGDLVRDTNRLLNGDRAAVDIRVDAGFKSGSFEIQLLLDQRIFESARETLVFLAAVDAQGLLNALFGAVSEHSDKLAEGVIVGLIALYKMLKGKKPKPESVTIHDNHGTIAIGNGEIKVDARSVKLYMNDPIRADLDRILLPVAKDGIDQLKVSKDGSVLDELNKSDLPERLSVSEGSTESTSQVLTSTREALVKVVTAGFEEGKWKFSDGSSKFTATIADPVFQEKLDNRLEGFYKGDVLRVVLTSTQTEKAEGKIQTKHTVLEVLEHRQVLQQKQLFLNSSTKKQ